MPLFLISYDEHPQRDYTECYKLMAEWKAAKVLESLWLAELAGPAEAIRNIVSATFAGSASVAVIQLFPNGDWATAKGYNTGNKWLQTHMNL
ncbi:hypothetical protein GCM10022276_27600 [Sphingomonas limnosediminicola]|uniref:CRISPR-associated protein Cas2 n=1 Tax=Sphingomonas limnosediminicola TaxID=940133 RepID=A0ABP7LUJ9_9SPHN